ncbi:DUF6952 family protein [Reichenbachiella versicolor]|uniref:DUF6952 family protein n=1 Tax=Reichenbachiella versicolor TaxID=1821036 RepID=UPI000D6E3D06|nr:hypothetical protein [Reichenbachiella versicolor]
MDISILQNLVEKYTVDEISQAEETLLIEGQMPFDLNVADDSEALDLLSAATWIIERMASHEQSFDDAFQRYMSK